jgi:hypothetical protein
MLPADGRHEAVRLFYDVTISHWHAAAAAAAMVAASAPASGKQAARLPEKNGDMHEKREI